jgi:hypothetical protein
MTRSLLARAMTRCLQDQATTPSSEAGDRTSCEGGPGDDVLRTSDGIEGNDQAWGGPGSDVCVIDPGDEAFGCDEVQVHQSGPSG